MNSKPNPLTFETCQQKIKFKLEVVKLNQYIINNKILHYDSLQTSKYFFMGKTLFKVMSCKKRNIQQEPPKIKRNNLVFNYFYIFSLFFKTPSDANIFKTVFVQTSALSSVPLVIQPLVWYHVHFLTTISFLKSKLEHAI